MNTSSERVSSKARRTLALGFVVFYKTCSIGAAGIGSDTWIDAVAKIAGLVPWAIFIRLTTNRLRYDCWKVKKVFKFSPLKPRIWACYSLIFSQRSSPFPVYPGMQVQDIVLNGNVLWTVHSALLAQGAIAKHGSLHFSCKHDCLLGQSLSVVHSTFGIGTVLE